MKLLNCVTSVEINVLNLSNITHSEFKAGKFPKLLGTEPVRALKLKSLLSKVDQSIRINNIK